jgi:subtilisin-like proprotein convertase family protein
VPAATDIEVSFAYLVDAAAVCGSAVTAEISVDWANGSHQIEASPEWVGARETTIFSAEDTTGGGIPDNDLTGLIREVIVDDPLGMTVVNFTLSLNITHTFRGDLAVNLSNPAATNVPVFEGEDTDSGLSIVGDFPVPQFTGASAGGTYTLNVVDRVPEDVGTLNSWGVTIEGERYDCTASWTEQQVDDWLLSMLLGINSYSPALDFNGDGVVNIADLVVRVGSAP